MTDTKNTLAPDEIIPPKKEKRKPGFPQPKLHGMLNKTTREAVKLAAEYEVPPVEAYKAITGKAPSEGTLKRMEDAIEKWSLRHPSSLKLASKTIKNFAAGKEVNGIKPKDSTVLAASQRIVDATDPVVKRQENLNINVDLHPIDLSKYRG